MAVDGVQAEAHRDHRDMGTPGRAPCIELRREAANAPLRKRDIVGAEVFDRPTQAGDAITQPPPGVDAVVDAATEEDEAVRQPGGPVKGCFAGPAQPDRDRPRRFRYECGSV